MIVIPMAGMSSRFFKVGYTLPKYMLEAQGKSVFEHSVNSFDKYFKSETFVFIVKNLYNTEGFVEEKAKSMGIENFHVVVLSEDTRGQAETVMLGLKGVEKKGFPLEGAITIFNIDTFRPGFTFPNLENMGDGYLEVFKGIGDNWSFAKPLNQVSTIVCQTAEKEPISNLCSTGLYHFSNVNDYMEAYVAYSNLSSSKWDKGELYVAPLYNHLIDRGFSIHYNLINQEDVVFCGIPSEFEDFSKGIL